jgi:iron-sulfur cluster assembly protein
MSHARLKVELSAGESLLDALSRRQAAITHECGGKLSCATCMVIVHAGEEVLNSPGNEELDMLDRAGAPDGARLACQVKGEGEVEIEIPAREAEHLAIPDAVHPISLSEGAARHLRLQLQQANAEAVRLRVVSAGCSGFGYKVETAEAIADDDAIFESCGIRIVVDPASLPRIHGTTLDLVQEGLARRIRFDNPNARQTCGCGESFGA